MKLLTFLDAGNVQRLGAVTDDGIVDLTKRLGAGFGMKRAVTNEGLEAVRSAMKGAAADYALNDVVYAPVVPDPDRIICVGLNYAEHQRETGRSAGDYPLLFVRFPSSQVGHGCALIKPGNSDRYDYEGELAVIIGTPGRHIPEAEALNHIAGYSCYNDGSVRDWQRHTTHVTPGKNFPNAASFGPWLVTRDEIPDPTDLMLTTRLNGDVVQHSKTDELIFSIPRLIAYISGFTPLSPGDVIVTGTPSGVGDVRTPPLYMKPGDEVSVEISKIGTLANRVVAEEPVASAG